MWRWCLCLLALAASSSAAGEVPNDALKELRGHRLHGRYEEAVELAEKLVAEHPEADEVRRELVQCRFETGQWDEAGKEIAAWRAALPKSAEGAGFAAELAFERGDFDAADKAVAEALARDDDQLRARLVAARLLASRGKLKEADEAFRWFVRYYNRKQPKRADELLLVAEGASVYARWNGVPQIFEFVVNTLCPDALADDPECWTAHAIAGALLVEKYNESQGVPELKKGLALNPRAARLHALLAGVAVDNHDFDAAERSIAQALEAHPGHVASLCLRAKVLLALEKPVEARGVLDETMKVAPRSEQARGLLAIADLARDGLPPEDQLAELLDHFDNIGAAKFSEPVPSFISRGREMATLNPRAGEYLTAIGETLESSRRMVLAEKFYLAASNLAPQRVDARTRLGLLYMQMGRTDDARKALDLAIRKDPYHVRANNMRKVIDLLDGYQSLQTEHFVVRYDSKTDGVMARLTSEFLEAEHGPLAKQFGYEPPERTQFEIYNRAKGRSAHEWFSTRMVGLPWIQTIGASTGMMVALASPAAAERQYNWTRVLRHEYVHILTLRKTAFNIPHWYTETLAVTSEDAPRPEDWELLLVRRFDKQTLFNLDTVNNGFQKPKNADDWTQAYSQSHLYGEFMTATYGPDALGKLLEAYVATRDTATALKAAFGVTKTAFEEGYTKFVAARVETARPWRADEAKDDLAALAKRHEEDPDDMEVAGRLSRAQLVAGNRRVARDLAKRVHEAAPSNPYAAMTLAALARRAEETGQAVDILKKAWNPEQPVPEVVTELGTALLLEKRPAEAAEVYRAGLKVRPWHLEWHKRLALAELRGGDNDRLKSSLETIARLDGDDFSVRLKRAQMAWEEKDFETAMKYARLAVEANAANAQAHALQARGERALKRYEKSLASWRNAVDLAPKEFGWEVERAETEIDAGMVEEARARLGQLLSKPAAEVPQSVRDRAAKLNTGLPDRK
jgi:cellulose synthase operon protein C